MNNEELKKALEHDQAQRSGGAGSMEDAFEKVLKQRPDLAKQIADNKAQALASGAAREVTPEMAAKVARARTLQAELGGYRQLSVEAKTNPNVVKTINPKLLEYCSLRMEIVMFEAIHSLSYELGMEQASVVELLDGVMGATEMVVESVEERTAVDKLRQMAQRATDLASSGDMDGAEKLLSLAERLKNLI